MWRGSRLSLQEIYIFLLTHPVWDVTSYPISPRICLLDFYSHIPCGMWLWGTAFLCKLTYFYSHIPCGMWPKPRLKKWGVQQFLLTHPVWDVTYQTLLCRMHWQSISTHTSRVGCDRQSQATITAHLAFLLTHPVWDVTFAPAQLFATFWISTHTSRVGCDQKIVQIRESFSYFYSHIPCGMWRWLYGIAVDLDDFYSHIPCGMWPKRDVLDAMNMYHFYSHIPCGMWLWGSGSYDKVILFLLTHPVWDVTAGAICKYPILCISTHTSRVGCDLFAAYWISFLLYFYSHIPCGMWLLWLKRRNNQRDFYSHIPCGMWHWFTW